ncbi:galactose oxidase [Irpex rosettiformis]|uniref:Galactose oxidase n=1 Tax=Irpex rosettiformis TaxID=378272 RepID=A0ACB8TU56_9APHY|nr:galactose oxidase [Irpex rosettiformis]
MGVSSPIAGKSKGRSKSPSSATVREKDASSSSGKEGRVVASKSSRAPLGQTGGKYRQHPHLPTGNADPVPATLMYWSKAPVYGVLPIHGLRAHSATLVDGVTWIFGGCDEKGCWKDVWCFNTETMQWSNPATVGDVPPPCRAHTATLVDKKLVIFGGGEGPVYYNEVYVLDTVTRQWQHPQFGPPTHLETPPTIPPPRRAHTAVLYRGRIWVFGGGNGTQALNDLWTLEVGNNASVDRMKWEMMKTGGKTPSPRGYHTANLVGNVMVVVGGSDGRECFSDIWCLNLDTLQWSQVKLQTQYRRLSHTATQVGSYLFIWGGHNGSSYTSELLLFNLVALVFENRAPAGRAPSARAYHAALLTDSRLFVFGGFNGNDVYDDVYILDLAGAAYLPQVTSFRIDVE